MMIDLWVEIEKPTNEEEIKEIKNAINLLNRIDKGIGRCSTGAWEDNPDFRNAAHQLEKILAGEWKY